MKQPGAAMQTADWALVISICSAAVSLAGFVWNVWSKFIYPKPKVRVSVAFMTVFNLEPNQPKQDLITLSATNMGPAAVTLRVALTRGTHGWMRRHSYALLNPLHNYPVYARLSIGPFGGGLPKKVEVGEEFSVHFIPDHEGLSRDDYDRIGFSDTFGRRHWASWQEVIEMREKVRALREELGSK